MWRYPIMNIAVPSEVNMVYIERQTGYWFTIVDRVNYLLDWNYWKREDSEGVVRSSE